MIEYRELGSAKRRLLAHYKKLLGEAIFPIDKIISDNNNVEMPFMEGDEFLINVYLVIDFFKLYLTSRRLILKREETEIAIKYENIIAVYLEFPFKKEEAPHYLNIITDTQRLILIDFLDVLSLVNARNEIYRVIDVMIIDWRGRFFKVSDVTLSNLEIIRMPLH